MGPWAQGDTPGAGFLLDVFLDCSFPPTPLAAAARGSGEMMTIDKSFQAPCTAAGSFPHGAQKKKYWPMREAASESD